MLASGARRRTSLHYYFPWAIKTLVKWTVFCLATGRQARLDTDTRAYFDISDRPDLDYGQKLDRYRKLADAHFAVDEYRDFCAAQLPDLDERVLDWASGPEFDQLIIDTVTATYPEHERWLSHPLRGGTLPAGCGMGGLTWPERQSKAPPGRGRGLC